MSAHGKRKPETLAYLIRVRREKRLQARLDAAFAADVHAHA